MNTRITSKDLKRMARTTLQGRFAQAVSLTLSYCLFSMALSILLSYSGLSTSSTSGLVLYIALYIIILLLEALLETGLIRFLYLLCSNAEFNNAGLFYAFRAQPDTYIITYAVRYALIFVCFVPAIIAYVNTPVITDLTSIPDGFVTWTVISIVLAAVGLVPALYFMLRFGLATYVLLDEPLISAKEALTKSADIMRGNYGRVLHLWLSFIPMGLLCIGSMGMGYFWVKPYFDTAMGHMYLCLTGRAQVQETYDGGQTGYSDYYAG